MADKNAIELSIGLRADDSQLAGDIARIKAKVDKTDMPASPAAATEATKAVEDLGEKTEKAASKGKESFGALGDKLRDVKKKFGEQIEVVQGLIGKFAAVGAVATIFYNIGKVIGDQIVDKLETASEKAANFLMTVDKSDAKGAIKKISDRVAELNAEIASTDELFQQFANSGLAYVVSGGIARLFAKDREKLIEERKKLLEDLKGLSNYIKQQQADEALAIEREAGRKSLEANLQRLKLEQDLVRSTMSVEEKIRAEANDRIAALNEAFLKMSNERQLNAQEQHLRDIQKINEKAAYDIEQYQQEQAEKRDKFIRDEANAYEQRRQAMEDFNEANRAWMKERMEAAQKEAEAARNSWVKALRDIRNEANQLFAHDQANSLTQLASQFQTQTITAQAGLNRIYVEGVG